MSERKIAFRLTTSSGRFAESSAMGDRMRSAGVRAMEACSSIKRSASRLIEELDETTSPHGIPVELDAEDSMALVVERAIAGEDH